MASVATFLVFLALAGALASWIAGAVFYAHTLSANDNGESARRWLAVVAWPLALGRVRKAGGHDAARVNKALVAFIACMLVAAAAVSASTNLHRLPR
jgi:hypothetical protein